MQEESIPMSEEEASDTEIVMLDPSQPYTKSLQALQNEQQLQNQVSMIDTQLKALGLYEEGMSFEQKEELLAVVAASRETARKEESMRMKAKEWSRKVFPDDLQIPAPPEDPPLLPSTSIPLVEVSSSTENSLQSTDVKLCSISQDFVDVSTTRKTIPELHVTCVDEDQQVFKDHQQLTDNEQQKANQIVRPHYQSVQVEVCHQQYDSQDLEDELDIIEVDFYKQRRDLEKSIPEWKPCSSPEAPSIYSNRYSAKQKCFINSTSEDSEQVLQSIDEFHTQINKFQRSSGIFIPWGQPVTVGRAYATRSSRRNGPDSENSDSLCLFPSVDTRENGSSMCESYLRLRQYSMQLNHGGSSHTTNPARESQSLQRMANLTIPRVAPFTSNSCQRSKPWSKKPKYEDSNSCPKPPKVLTNFSNRQSSESISPGVENNSFPTTSPGILTNSTEAKCIESRENQNPFSKLIKQESPLRGQQHIVNLEHNTSKRKCLPSSSVKNFNTCAKRLKGTGTA